MSDKIEELLAKMAEKSDQQNDTIQQQSIQIANLLTALQGMPGVNAPISVTVQPAAQNDVAVRACCSLAMLPFLFSNRPMGSQYFNRLLPFCNPKMPGGSLKWYQIGFA